MNYREWGSGIKTNLWRQARKSCKKKLKEEVEMRQKEELSPSQQENHAIKGSQYSGGGVY